MVLMPIPINVRQFYLDDRRRASAEVAYGLEWTSELDPGAHYGIHWIEVTREVYALRGPRSPVFLYNTHYGGSATIPPQLAEDQYQVVVLGKADSTDVLDEVLSGWQQMMPLANSLEWARDRLAEVERLQR
jgi:hypothetical protein